MTMFSMKPKFDLAEFLAVPANAGAFRSRSTNRRNMQLQRNAPSREATESTPAEDTDATGDL